VARALDGAFLKVKSELGIKAMHRKVAEAGGTYALREQSEAYAGNFAGESDALTPENAIRSKKNSESTGT